MSPKLAKTSKKKLLITKKTGGKQAAVKATKTKPPPSVVQTAVKAVPPVAQKPIKITITKHAHFLLELMPKGLFSVFLAILQVIIRIAAKDTNLVFIGPALAAAGASMTVSLISFHSSKTLPNFPNSLYTWVKKNGLIIETHDPSIFNTICATIVFGLILLWAWIVVLSMRATPDTFTIGSAVLITPIWLGLLCYIIGFVITIIKEFVL